MTETTTSIPADHVLEWRDHLPRPVIRDSASALPHGLYDCLRANGTVVCRIKVGLNWAGRKMAWFANRHGGIACWLDAHR